MLRSEDWQLVTEVSRQSIGPVFKDQETLKKGPIGCPKMSVTSCQCILCDSHEREGFYIVFIIASDLKSRIYSSKICDVTSEGTTMVSGTLFIIILRIKEQSHYTNRVVQTLKICIFPKH